jgi:hypothetical protein
MSYETVIRVKHVPSGEVRTHSWTEERKHLCDFIWTEGNYACDCNRGLFFERAANPEYDGDPECGHDKYVLESVDVDGVRIIENNKATDAADCS